MIGGWISLFKLSSKSVLSFYLLLFSFLSLEDSLRFNLLVDLRIDFFDDLSRLSLLLFLGGDVDYKSDFSLDKLFLCLEDLRLDSLFEECFLDYFSLFLELLCLFSREECSDDCFSID